MDANISAPLAQLPYFSRQKLLDLWQKLFRRAAPPGMRRSLLIPLVAYRLQERAYGGLKSSTRAELRRIARTLEKNSDSVETVVHLRIKPGTHIARQWRGKTHEVAVTEFGFEYGGTNYRSMSQIARKITGTRWSGPAFFGLRRKATARDDGCEQ
jgi:hypothetical protein